MFRAGSTRDHPRARGEHYATRALVNASAGSSPRTRGALLRQVAGAACRGIIPAHAGSTRRTRRQPTPVRDHPRARGEHTGTPAWAQSVGGSSPRTRGALGDTPPGGAGHGIIPAHAGSTSATVNVDKNNGDHPRARGEHLGVLLPAGGARGSSPRTRGAPIVARSQEDDPGIIPAHAGSTVTATSSHGASRDHPRARGEHFPAIPSNGSPLGSSPRTRGARPYTGEQIDRMRIIPAHAGSTQFAFEVLSPSTDHPRARGEHGRVHFPTFGAGWIIPAHAGSTSGSGNPSPWSRDHPRARGEHPLITVVLPRMRGSSPRTRGALDRHLSCVVRPWIIPAHAGSTRRCRSGWR